MNYYKSNGHVHRVNFHHNPYGFAAGQSQSVVSMLQGSDYGQSTEKQAEQLIKEAQAEEKAVQSSQPQGQMLINGKPFEKKEKNLYQKYKWFLSPIAMGISYSRNKSIWKSLGAGIFALPYLAYVGYDMYTKKPKRNTRKRKK